MNQELTDFSDLIDEQFELGDFREDGVLDYIINLLN
jgi:hypothetical protein